MNFFYGKKMIFYHDYFYKKMIYRHKFYFVEKLFILLKNYILKVIASRLIATNSPQRIFVTKNLLPQNTLFKSKINLWKKLITIIVQYGVEYDVRYIVK